MTRVSTIFVRLRADTLEVSRSQQPWTLLMTPSGCLPKKHLMWEEPLTHSSSKPISTYKSDERGRAPIALSVSNEETVMSRQDLQLFPRTRATFPKRLRDISAFRFLLRRASLRAYAFSLDNESPYCYGLGHAERSHPQSGWARSNIAITSLVRPSEASTGQKRFGG